MSVIGLPLHQGLRETTRLGSLTSAGEIPRLREFFLLVAMGGLAAGSSLLIDFSLRVPGHAILRVIFPMSIGLALVPRHWSGSIMGGAALFFAAGIHFGGLESSGWGATTSLVVTGPILDWTLRRARGGWRQYAAFACAGMFSNLIAFSVRFGVKAFSLENAIGKSISVWLPRAIPGYIICGLLAGFISGSVWFYRKRRDESPTETNA